MPFKPHYIYHIYNQGNNQELIFFEERNYAYFFNKMRKHLLPNVYILAYCLMPNHFHWLVCVKPYGCERSRMIKPNKFDSHNQKEDHYQQNLSAAIAVTLRSYTRAVNNQQNRSGSLFRQKTKTEDGNVIFPAPVPDHFSRTKIITETCPDSEKAGYWQTCFDYIHQNPVNANLVQDATQWKYNSARDYFFQFSHSICNMDLSRKIGLEFSIHKPIRINKENGSILKGLS